MFRFYHHNGFQGMRHGGCAGGEGASGDVGNMKRGLVWAAVMIASVSLVVAQQPVDTHQFGLIQYGMTEAEVRQRLGPPAKMTRGAYLTEAGTLEIGRLYHYPGTRRCSLR
jgi:hypothetical protein